MIIGITCSRSLAKDKVYLKECILKIINKHNMSKMTFLTGDAISDYACCEILEPFYDIIYLKPAHKVERVGYDPRLFMARNKNVVDNCDVLISIWDGESRGTKNTTDYAKRNNKKVIEFVKRLEVTFHN